MPLRLFRHDSFEIAYRRLALPVLKFIVKKMGGDQVAAEEVFARTISAAWESWHSFEHKSSYFTWICRIALNKMADYYRNQVHERSRIIAPTFEMLADLGQHNLSPEEKLALQELKSCVLECLMLLPPQKRRLLYLKYWKELSHKEIGKILGLTEIAVEGQLYRAKQALR